MQNRVCTVLVLVSYSVFFTIFLLITNQSHLLLRIMGNNWSDNWNKRREALKDYCERKPVLLEKKMKHLHRDSIYKQLLVRNIVHVELLKINWCLVPKVASSSVSRALLPFLRNKTEGKVKNYPFVQAEVWDRAGHMKYEEFLSEEKMTPTFLICRHPLTRLASAYRNKLQPGTRTGDYFIKEYGRVISTKSRGSWKPADPDPTFPEFVKYLIKTKAEYYDEHWMPISLRCRVCQVSHNFILHYEDLQRDWDHFLGDVNITEKIELPWDNRGHGDVNSYYQNISRQDLESLYKKYEADFVMFGYSIEDFNKISK